MRLFNYGGRDVPHWSYKGLELKSKKEVYWAAWLDKIQVPYAYEPFRVPIPEYGQGRIRIPDFLLTVGVERWILEIKGELTPKLKRQIINAQSIADELVRMILVAYHTQCPTFMGFNWPGIDTKRNSRETKSTNRSSIYAILPNFDTFVYPFLCLHPSRAETREFNLNSPIGQMAMKVYVEGDRWYFRFPEFKTIVVPDVYFRLGHAGGTLRVDPFKPAKLSMREKYIQDQIRQTKFRR